MIRKRRRGGQKRQDVTVRTQYSVAKLEEASFFFAKLLGADPESRDWEYYFSAFVSASRSVGVSPTGRQAGWYASQPAEDQAFLRQLNDLRDVEVHELVTSLNFLFRSPTRCGHERKVRDGDGTTHWVKDACECSTPRVPVSRVLWFGGSTDDAIATCKRWLGMLENAVRSVAPITESER